MSLIIATSRLNEDETQTTNQRPSNFQNFFRSAIEIEADSEIAVDSVKIERTGNVTVGAKHFFCHYFGKNPEGLQDGDEYNDLTSISRTIQPKRGTYSVQGYIRQLTSDMNAQYDDPRIYGNASVLVEENASTFQTEGIAIKFTDRGKSTTDVTASLVGKAVFNLANPSAYYANASNLLKPSDSFTWPGAAKTFSRTGASSAVLTNSSCVGILTGRPFCLNEGEFIVDVANASAKPFCVGLSRPQIQYESPTNSVSATNASTFTDSERASRYVRIKDLVESAAREDNDTNIRTYDDQGVIAGPYEMYDYVFIQDEDDNITIAQRVYMEDEESFVHQELEYWASGGSVTGDKMTKTEFYATYDAIKFEAYGDEIRLFFRVAAAPGAKAAVVYHQIVGSNLSSAGAVGKTFSPIGSTTYALYPQIHLGNGSVDVDDYFSNYTGTDTSYAYPTFVEGAGATSGYTPGDDMFSNEAVYGLSAEPYIKVPPSRVLASDSVQDAVFKCDTSNQKLDNVAGLQHSPYVFALMNPADSVDFAHILTMNKFTRPYIFDTLTAAQLFPSMSGRLGFPDRVIVSSKSGDGYVAGDDTKVVTFTSVEQIEKTALSSFIRLPGLTHKSFNGAQSGLSKIVYQLPQFSNDGREFGALFFQPGEKTYVKLNNPSPLILNSLQVQIVDPFEKETSSLTGDTQIVFHIRKRK